MKKIYQTSRFKKNVKKMKKRGKNFKVFKQVIHKLVSGVELEAIYRDHKLIGDFEGMRECHIEPDWLLIYETEKNYITLVNTGTHSDLFKK